MHDSERLYYIMPSYNIEYSKFSPGKILLYFLFEWCSKKGIEVFDFTEGKSKYKLQWSNDSTNLYDTIFIKSIKGYIYYFLTYFKNLLRNRKIYFNIY